MQYKFAFKNINTGNVECRRPWPYILSCRLCCYGWCPSPLFRLRIRLWWIQLCKVGFGLFHPACHGRFLNYPPPLLAMVLHAGAGPDPHVVRLTRNALLYWAHPLCHPFLGLIPGTGCGCRIYNILRTDSGAMNAVRCRLFLFFLLFYFIIFFVVVLFVCLFVCFLFCFLIFTFVLFCCFLFIVFCFLFVCLFACFFVCFLLISLFWLLILLLRSWQCSFMWCRHPGICARERRLFYTLQNSLSPHKPSTGVSASEYSIQGALNTYGSTSVSRGKPVCVCVCVCVVCVELWLELAGNWSAAIS